MGFLHSSLGPPPQTPRFARGDIFRATFEARPWQGTIKGITTTGVRVGRRVKNSDVAGLVAEELSADALAAGGDEQVRAVAPAFEKAAEVLTAKLIPLVVVQLSPLPVFVTDKGKRGVGDDPETLVFELETIVDVQVSVKAETFPHQPDGLHRLPPKGYAVGLHSVSLALFYFLVKMAQVVGGHTIGPEDSH